MRRNSMLGTMILVLTGFSAGPLLGQSQGPGNPPAPPRRPYGIYAKINISAEIASQKKLHPTQTDAELNDHFNTLYQEILGNQAVSGLALQAHWDQLNPNTVNFNCVFTRSCDPFAGVYDWTYLDDAFTQVANWNTDHPRATPKTIQFIITPGFQSPQWLLEELSSCDGLFEIDHLPPPGDCGKVTFTGDVEEQDSTELPLPWNPTYKSAWRAFLVDLNSRYGSNTALVSIAVAGPTAASEEMIIPNSNSAKHPNVTNPQIFPGHGIFTPHGIIYVPSPPISPNNMWVALMQFHYTAMGAPIPAYQSTDQAFIDEWDNAIDMYGEIFLGLTLVATTGSGLPNFNDLPVAPPSGYGPDCEDENMDCAAEATILSYFAEASIGGANAKATQTSGLEVSRADNVDLGVLGVKFLSDTTATPNDFSTQILGGLQLNTSVSQHAEEEGSSSVVEQALYNVLQVIFNGTAVASSYCQTVGMAPLNYVQIYSNDFLYAGKNGAVSVHEGSCLGTHSMSAQDELNAASALLLSISEPQPAP